MMDKIKMLWQHKWFKILVGVGCLVVMVVYMNRFTQEGVPYKDVFLEETIEGNFYIYEGKHYQGDIKIQVDRSDDINLVTYDLPAGINESYYVVHNQTSRYSDMDVTVMDQSEEILFVGQYKDGNIPVLFQEGKPFMQDFMSVRSGAVDDFEARYHISYYNVVSFAVGDNVVKRGDNHLLFSALLLVFVLVIDIKWPLFFFNLKYVFSVKDPEPTEFYIMIQKIGWYIVPVIVGALLFFAL